MKNVLSDANLISWLETQDPEERYRYCDPDNCLAARYCHDFGLDYTVAGASGPDSFLKRLECVAVTGPHTYGAALARAKILD